METKTEGSPVSVVQRELGGQEQQGETGLGFDNVEHAFGFELSTIISELNH